MSYDLSSSVDTGKATWNYYRTIIESAINNQPRTLQTRIGPSELGTECDRCLISKLAGLPEIREGIAWLPWIGNAVHDQLERAFMAENARLGKARYLVEHRVSVGKVGDIEVSGSADLFDLYMGEVTDWKITGKNTLTKVKRGGPTPVYRRQAHLYGFGFSRGGASVRRVRIAYLPRNEPSLDGAFIWSEPYNEDIAIWTLKRADDFAHQIKLFGVQKILALAPEHLGDYGCARYPEGAVTRASQSNEFSDITG